MVGGCFSIGREGSHGAKNNAPEATKNCFYLIDIIALFRFADLTNTLLYAYPVVMITRERMQNTLIQRLFWHTSERDESNIGGIWGQIFILDKDGVRRRSI